MSNSGDGGTPLEGPLLLEQIQADCQRQEAGAAVLMAAARLSSVRTVNRRITWAMRLLWLYYGIYFQVMKATSPCHCPKLPPDTCRPRTRADPLRTGRGAGGQWAQGRGHGGRGDQQIQQRGTWADRRAHSGKKRNCCIVMCCVVLLLVVAWKHWLILHLRLNMKIPCDIQECVPLPDKIHYFIDVRVHWMRIQTEIQT